MGEGRVDVEDHLLQLGWRGKGIGSEASCVTVTVACLSACRAHVGRLVATRNRRGAAVNVREVDGGVVVKVPTSTEDPLDTLIERKQAA